jgi:hypothetical protein
MIGQPVAVADADDARAFLEAQGFEIRVRPQDRHAELMARGEPGQASFYAEGREYYCVDLRSDGAVAWSDFAVGETEDAAVVSAMRRFQR